VPRWHFSIIPITWLLTENLTVMLLLFFFVKMAETMADTKESRLCSSVQKDPNFAVICSFLSKYGTLLGLADVSFDQLEKWVDETRYGECRVVSDVILVGDLLKLTNIPID